MTDVLRLSGPLTLWLISFSAVYGVHGIVCAQGALLSAGGLPSGRAALLMTFSACVIMQATALALLTTRRFGGPPGFVRRVSLTLGVASFVAVVWTLLPVAVLSMCRP